MKRRIIKASKGVNPSKVKLPKNCQNIKEGARVYLVKDLDLGYFDQISCEEYYRYSKELANYAEQEEWLYDGTDEDGDFVGVKIPRGTILRYAGRHYALGYSYYFEVPFCKDRLIFEDYNYENLADSAVTQSNNIEVEQ